MVEAKELDPRSRVQKSPPNNERKSMRGNENTQILPVWLRGNSEVLPPVRKVLLLPGKQERKVWSEEYFLHGGRAKF